MDKFIRLWEREAVLSPGALLIQFGSGDITGSTRRVTERLPGIVFLASRGPVCLNRPVLRFEVEKPPPVEQKRLWAGALGSSGEDFNGALDELSEQFRLSAKTIFSTGSLLSRKKGTRGPISFARHAAPFLVRGSRIWPSALFRALTGMTWCCRKSKKRCCATWPRKCGTE